MMSNNFKPLLCPVCEEFYFSDLQEGDVVEKLYCHHCGWKYDIDQANDINLPNGKNQKSVVELKKDYAEKIANNSDYNYLEETYSATPHKCPVCGQYTFADVSSFDICPFCGWTDDELMENEPDKWAGNANDLCLNDYKKRYNKFKSENPNYKHSEK